MAEALVEFTKSYLLSRHGKVEPFLDAETIKSVLECMREAKNDQTGGGGVDALNLGDGIQVYNVTVDVKPFSYQVSTKEWVASSTPATLFPASDVKAQIYSSRFYVILQRTLLEGRLVAEEEANVMGLLPNQRVLTKVESLQGNPGFKIVFGLIARVPADGARKWVIEGMHKSYALELEPDALDHLVTDGSFVLAEGRLVDNKFVASDLIVPSCVPRRITLVKDLVPRQIFGGNLTDEQLQLLTESEPGNTDGFYVVLCEIHLDSGRVLEKLADLFQGYEEVQPPTAYIFMGSFCSTPFVPTAEGVKNYQDGFERLKFMIRSLDNHIQNGTRWVFIPGPNDPGSHMLPRVPLPDYLTLDIAKDLPNVVLATNPCRIRHFSRELVFFRHDVLRQLRRHEVLPLRDPDGSTVSAAHARSQMVKFLLDQAHLVPLPMAQSSILWAYDHTLRLYPLPHAVFIGGVTQPFDLEYQECKFCSVGPFCREAEFYAYHPIKDLIEPCDVPDRAG